MGHPVLREVAREFTVAEILSPETQALVKSLVETMDEYGGIGIAAPQVHVSRSIALIDYQEKQDVDDDEKGEHGEEDHREAESLPLTVVINPKITVLDDTKQAYWEGCLSVPEIRGLVYRPRKVQIDYLDLEAKPQRIIAEGFLATVFQHELDHLFGVLFVDRISYSPGKSPISFTAEYAKYLTPDEDDEIGELDD